MRLALIKDGVVINVIEADTDFTPEPGLRAIASAEAGPGWTHDGGRFSPPHESDSAPPASVSMFQAREALRRVPTPDGSCLLDAVNAYVDAHRSDQPTLALAWEYATEVTREGVFVEALAKTFDLDAAALDRLFRQAAAIRA
ncbi:MAG: hypothetical protein ACR652_25565 [Methylocystis sp.]|uniref:hypothetical protein n=1 Tax=Methylocystis sp. TaxID=1911079 RepID=UPI003DA4E9CC